MGKISLIIAGPPSKPIKLAIAKPAKPPALINKFLCFSFGDRKRSKFKLLTGGWVREIHLVEK
ncbi:hypothetical protein GS682_25505 [Nostoc sp. B(2019)]|nr:hypothetical protein [Nostoc sp. B(2019)]